MEEKKIKTREGSGHLRQLYSSARNTAGSTHSHFKNLTTFLVNFVPVEKVDASELQVRVHFDDEEIQTLANSIKMHGVLQPILVVQNGDRYKVIAGERRLRASRLAGIERIPARVITSDDKSVHEIALRENLDRVDLHPIEEGEGYVSLLESKAYSSYEAIAQAFGKKKSRVTEYIGYTRLPAETRELVMRHGLKQRSVMRKLLDSEPETHKEIIAEIVKVGDSADDFMMPSTSQEKSEEKPKAVSEKKEVKSFEYQVSAKGLSVPGFRWKVGEGKERISDYAQMLKKLLAEIEAKGWS